MKKCELNCESHLKKKSYVILCVITLSPCHTFIFAWVDVGKPFSFSFVHQPMETTLACFVRVVNLSSQMGSLEHVSPSLRKQFASPTLTVPEIVELMEKYLR